MKKRLAVLMFTVIMTVSSLPVCAKEKVIYTGSSCVSLCSTDSNSAISSNSKRIAKQLGGEAISAKDLPKGVKPLHFNSVSEAKRYIKKQKSIARKMRNKNIASYDNNSELFALGAKKAATGSDVKRWKIQVEKVPAMELNVHATYTYTKKNGKIKSVDSVTSSLSGTTLGCRDWTQEGYTSEINSDAKGFCVYVYGHYDYYAFVKTNLLKIGTVSAGYNCWG